MQLFTGLFPCNIWTITLLSETLELESSRSLLLKEFKDFEGLKNVYHVRGKKSHFKTRATISKILSLVYLRSRFLDSVIFVEQLYLFAFDEFTYLNILV